MPDEPIRYLKEGGQGEITEKRSRFLATLQPVTSEEEACQGSETVPVDDLPNGFCLGDLALS